eukprot:TRINITY_DN748_c0_g1_i1.p2 TRINITY_DN748_c0_g1~~TRINITY_DN748_c0_g1_i1.p2  ORF type:complete len:174 (-),score=65.99 TRINITY_DN748_c0_g1_i1:170-691(-)
MATSQDSKQNVFVSIDPSECPHTPDEIPDTSSMRAVEAACKLVHDQDCLTFIAAVDHLTDVETTHVGYSDFAVTSPDADAPTVTEVDSEPKKKALAGLKNCALVAHKKGVKCEIKILLVTGDPKTAILKAIDHHQATMLVCGARKKNVIQKAFLGSVSNYFLEHTNIHVLVAK